MKDVLYTYHLKWLDYDKVVKNVIIKKHSYDELKINFYTAINNYKLDSEGRPHKSIANHKAYTGALKARGIEVIEGKFKPRSEKLNCYIDCDKCNQMFFIHKFNISLPNKVKCYCGEEINTENIKYFKKVEEKKDVKIAVDLINTARDGHYNRIYLFSTDSDFIPAAEYIKENCPDVELYVVAPSDKRVKKFVENGQIKEKSEFRYGTKEFEKIGVKVLRIKLSKFRECLLPDTINGYKNPWL